MAGKTLSLTFKIEDDGKGLKKLVADADSLQKFMGATVSEAERLNRQVVTFSALSNTIESVNSSITQFQGFMQGLTNAYAVQQEAETKLETVMRQRMAVTAEDIQSIKDLCSAQQELGIIGDEVQLAGAQQLATFLREKQSLDVLIPAMNDLVAQQKGFNAVGSDAVAVANMMGKALAGQTSALRRVGICFDDAQEKILKYGDENQRAAMLAEIITDNIGHVNAELAKTDSGRLKQLTNTLGDYKEMAGKAASAIQPTLTLVASLTTSTTGVFKFCRGVHTLMTVIKSWNIEQSVCNVVLKQTGVTAQITAAKNNTLAGSIGGLAVAAKRGTAVIKTTQMAIRGLMIVSGVGLAIWALTATIGYLTDSADDAADSLDGLTAAQHQAKQEAEDLEAARKEEIATGERARVAIGIDIKRLKEFNGTKAEERKLVDDMNNAYGESMGYFSSVADWYKALIANSETYCRQLVLEAKTRRLANQIAETDAEIHSLSYNEDGTAKKYSTKRSKYNEYSYLDAKGNEVSKSDREKNGLKNVKQLKLVQKERKDSDHDKVVANLDAKKKQRENLNKQLEAAIDESNNLSFKVTGSDNRPDTSDKSKDADKNAENARKKEIIGKDLSELETYEEIDIQRAHYEAQLRKAPAAMRPAIREHIDDLNGLKKQWEKLDGGFSLDDIVAETPIDQLETFEEIGIKRRQLSNALQSANQEEQKSIQDNIDKLDEYSAAMERSLKKPKDIGQLNTIKDITSALSYYKEVQSSQSADEAAGTEKTIGALERKLKAQNRGIELQKQLREVNEISQLSGKEFKVKVRSMGFDELSEKIREINRQLNDLENPPTEGQRKQLTELRGTYEQWRKECVKSFDTFREGWGGIEGSVSGIQSMAAVIEGGGNAWEKITGAVNGFIQLYEGIGSVIHFMELIGVISKANTIAKTAEAGATTIATTAQGAEAATAATAAAAMTPVIAANKAATSSYMELAAAEYFAAHASIPFAGFGIASGFISASAIIVEAMSAVGAFATGGIVGGSSMSGDKVLARVNSGEMILNRSQQGRLFNMLNSPVSVRTVKAVPSTFVTPTLDITPLRNSLRSDSDMGGKVEFEIDGRKLRGVLKRVNDLSYRS